MRDDLAALFALFREPAPAVPTAALLAGRSVTPISADAPPERESCVNVTRRVTRIATAFGTSCALFESGQVACWGADVVAEAVMGPCPRNHPLVAEPGPPGAKRLVDLGKERAIACGPRASPAMQS